MERSLEREIVRHARRVLRKYELKRWVARKYAQKYQKRTGNPPGEKAIPTPKIWALHPHFNPKYCIRHRKFLARTIWMKIKEGAYEPTPAVAINIPKPNGEFRQIMVFSIPDAAVGKLFRSRLTQRNAKIFSANSYAYRFDKNLFDALLYVQDAIKGEKVFLIQYDFKRYFDSISHIHLRRMVDTERHFHTSNIERAVIRSFLTHRYAETGEYSCGNFQQKKEGIPQGSSLSLWLANVAGQELDRDLERRNGQFARYADDVVCIAHSYEDALGIATAFQDHCSRAGLEINLEKSPGINLLSVAEKEDKKDSIDKIDNEDKKDKKYKEEMRSIDHFDYLGHKFTKSGIYLTDKAIVRIKQRISRIINVHLLHYPKNQGQFNQNRIGLAFYDWDLVTCLNEIRRYIYGGLTEANLDGLIRKNIRLPKVKGLMSFYVLISDPVQLRALDGWLLSSVRGALTERYKVLGTNFGINQIVPSTSILISGSWYSYPKIRNETRCPSFLRGWRGARKYYARFGLGDINPPKYYGY